MDESSTNSDSLTPQNGQRPFFVSTLSTEQKAYSSQSSSLFEVLGVIAKRNRSEVWPFSWGIGSLALTSAATSTYINWHFRNTLKLRANRALNYAVMFGVPAVTSSLLHFILVTRHILDSKSNTCSVCLQVRGMSIQAGASILCPLLLAPGLAYPIAKKLGLNTVPSLKVRNSLRILNFIKQVLTPIKGQLSMLTALHVIFGMGITFAEQLNYYTYIWPMFTEKNVPHSTV